MARAAGYVGRYRFSDTDVLVVTREGAALFGESPGVGRYPLFAEAEGAFFLDGIDAQIAFEPPASGPRKAIAATWRQGGQAQRGPRVE